jgi:hypothetical protein
MDTVAQIASITILCRIATEFTEDGLSLEPRDGTLSFLPPDSILRCEEWAWGWSTPLHFDEASNLDAANID